MIEFLKRILVIFLLLKEFHHTDAGPSFFDESHASDGGTGSAWDNLWKMSCDYVSNHLESSSVHRAKRSSINKLNSNIDFDDPEQLFNYLYPLAHVQAKDLIKRNAGDENESGRSNNIPDEYTVSSLIRDLAEFWQTECELRDISKDKDNETERRRRKDESHDKKNEDEIENLVAEVDEADENGRDARSTAMKKAKRNSRVLQNEESSLSMGSSDHGNLRLDQTQSMQAYFNSFGSGAQNVSLVTPHANRRRRRRKKKKKPLSSSSAILSKSDLDHNDDNEAGSSTTESSVNSTAAPAPPPPAPKSEDDNFFASYGGDIEYFFPLLSFGIPFDGEITFLGFHGFKGIFPYRR